MLNPDTPKGGYDMVSYLSQKYGPAVAQRVSSPDNPLSRAGKPLGLEFNPARRVVNTTDSHMLMELANEVGGDELANRLVEVVFRTYFKEAKDISDHNVLVACAVEVGLDESRVRAALQKDGDREKIAKLDAEVRSM
eukprot:c10671_g1_i6.p1 GENE.c10671_g1_i6~~c10671_g1_i6.p1  ORF type:complete len:137 (+),score=30.96 c10671_g1_i6:172-582(+)